MGIEHSTTMPSEEAIRDLIGRFWDCNIDRAEALEACEDGDADAFLKKRYEWCIAAKDERKGMADECMEEWKGKAKEEEAAKAEAVEEANTTKSGAKRPPETQIRELMRTFWDCNLDEAEAIEAIEAPGEPEAFLKERYEWCVAAKDERKGMADEAMEEWKEQQ